jgi:hypothetical protein
MTTPVQEQLHAFATALLERRGALVEWPMADRSGTVLLPPEVAATLGADAEQVSLGPQTTGHGLSVNLAGDFLHWAGQLIEAEPRVGVFRIRDLYLKRKDLEEGICRAFTWLNAKVKFQEARETKIEYHTWWFHGVLTSEDRWETRFSVSLNTVSGVEVAMPDPLGLWELEPRLDAPPTPPSYPWAAAVARRRLLNLAAAFLERMDSRLQRDRKRLHDYYHALLREANKKKTRGQTSPDPEKAEAANRAVQLELKRKLIELDDRYAMTATVQPVVLVRTESPVLAVDLSVFRKQARKTHTVYWNPLLKQFEPLLCSRCGDGAFGVAFTNEEVEPRCSKCETLTGR